MARTYVIADLHGRRDLLTAARRAIAARSRCDPATVVTLGDYVDRGPQSREVVELMANLQRDPPPKWRVVCLKGNHEALLEQALPHPARLLNWMGATPRCGPTARRALRDLSVIPADHRAWIAALQVIHVNHHRIYDVHAGRRRPAARSAAGRNSS